VSLNISKWTKEAGGLRRSKEKEGEKAMDRGAKSGCRLAKWELMTKHGKLHIMELQNVSSVCSQALALIGPLRKKIQIERWRKLGS
jgi:hypothetical protein